MRSTYTAIVPADLEAVFEAISSIDGLPAWNEGITSVVAAPEVGIRSRW